MDTMPHEEEEKFDHLSNLPESLLTSILSLIPTKQAAATSLLSKRWRYLWHCIAHLDLEQNLLPTDGDPLNKEEWESLLDCIQLSTQGPIKSCKISFSPTNQFFEDYSLHLDTFLLSLAERGIEELQVSNRGAGCYHFPSQIFFCSSLKKLELGKCMLSLSVSLSTNRCSNIRSLILFRVYFTNDQFEEMISCCMNLESLKVDSCVKMRHLKIYARKLSSLEITTLRPIRISLKDITSLREGSFEFLFAFRNTYVPYCDDLSQEEYDDQTNNLIQLLMDLSHGHVERLSFHFCVVFAEHVRYETKWNGAVLPKSLAPQYYLQAVKKLNFEISLCNLEMAAILCCLLNSCPNLYELGIQDKEHVGSIGSHWDHQSPAECLINRLRIVMIRTVPPLWDYLTGFLKYLLINSCVCQRLTICCTEDTWGKVMLEEKLKQIQWTSPHVVQEIKSMS